MKKYLTVIFFAFAAFSFSSAQVAMNHVSKCLITNSQELKYLKDFRIELGQGTKTNEFRFKATVPLWKNTKYRFTTCNDDNSKGKLILNITDDMNNMAVTSFDQKTGTIYPYVDFICNKTGVYQVYYDFNEGQSGSGVGIISKLK